MGGWNERESGRAGVAPAATGELSGMGAITIWPISFDVPPQWPVMAHAGVGQRSHGGDVSSDGPPGTAASPAWCAMVGT